MLYETDCPYFGPLSVSILGNPFFFDLLGSFPVRGDRTTMEYEIARRWRLFLRKKYLSGVGVINAFFFLAWAGGSQSLFGKATRVIVRFVEN